MTTPPTAPKPQADKFRDLARDLECDEDEAAFEDKVRRVASVQVGPEDSPQVGRRGRRR